MYQHGIHQGAWEEMASSPPLHCSHLVTFMMLLFGQQPFDYSPMAPTLCLSSLLNVTVTVLPVHLCQEAGPVFSLQLVLGAWQLSRFPGHWGIQPKSSQGWALDTKDEE